MEMLHTSVDLENIVEQIPNLLQRGGMSSMMNTALMAFCGFSFIGALTVCGSMELILERIMKHIHGTGQLITLTVALGVVMITVIGEATVTFLMIGGMFRPEYIKRGLESKNLSRSLEDSITVYRLFSMLRGQFSATQVYSLQFSGDLQDSESKRSQKILRHTKSIFSYPENHQRNNTGLIGEPLLTFL